MARYRATIETGWPPAEVFDYLSDFSHAEEWDPSVIEATRLGDPPVGVGAQFRLVARFMGRSTPLTYRTTEYEPPRAVTFHAENASAISHDRITLEQSGSATAVTYAADLRLKGALRLADPLFALAFRRLGDRAREGLRQVLSRPRRPAGTAA